jgi:hypothetical protein
MNSTRTHAWGEEAEKGSNVEGVVGSCQEKKTVVSSVPLRNSEAEYEEHGLENNAYLRF